MKLSSRELRAVVVVLLALGAGQTRHLADSVVFTLDTNNSSVAITGQALSVPLQAQGPGSLVARYTGSIIVALTNDALQFSGGSAISALDSGSWQPQPGGADGSAPANYGLALQSLAASGVGAVRGVQFDLLSEVLTATNGAFAATNLAIQFATSPSTTFDYQVSGLPLANSGSLPLLGFSTNQVAGLAWLGVTGQVQTLVIPLNATLSFQLLTPGDFTITFQGQLVATRKLGSALTLTSIAVTNQVVALQWPSVPGQAYQVLSSSDLRTWTVAATNIVAASASTTWTNAPAQTRQFYRIAF